MSDLWQSFRNAIRGSEITLTISLTAAYFIMRWLSGPRGAEGDKDKKGKKAVQAAPPPLKKDHVYNKAELLKYNGTAPGHVLVAIRGKVFDVTEGKSFYGPGGPYAAFAGVDASRMLAKMQTQPDEKDPAIDDLTAQEISSLESWEQFFGNKYPVVGTYV